MKRWAPVLLCATLIGQWPSVSLAGRGDVALTVFGGYYAAGEIFTARSSGPLVIDPYTTPDGRPSPGRSLQANLDEFFGGGVRLRYGLKDQLWIGVGFSLTDMDVTALTTGAGSNASKVAYDQAFVLASDVSVAYDLAAQGNTVYLLGGLGYNSLDFENRPGFEDIDQGKPAVVFGVGYRLRSIEGIELDFEIRDSLSGADFDAEADRLQPTGNFDGASAIHIWQFTAGWSFVF
jgi:hypothetical protein